MAGNDVGAGIVVVGLRLQQVMSGFHTRCTRPMYLKSSLLLPLDNSVFRNGEKASWLTKEAGSCHCEHDMQEREGANCRSTRS